MISFALSMVGALMFAWKCKWYRVTKWDIRGRADSLRRWRRRMVTGVIVGPLVPVILLLIMNPDGRARFLTAFKHDDPTLWVFTLPLAVFIIAWTRLIVFAASRHCWIQASRAIRRAQNASGARNQSLK
jgi:hypothetical protein